MKLQQLKNISQFNVNTDVLSCFSKIRYKITKIDFELTREDLKKPKKRFYSIISNGRYTAKIFHDDKTSEYWIKAE